MPTGRTELPSFNRIEVVEATIRLEVGGFECSSLAMDGGHSGSRRTPSGQLVIDYHPIVVSGGPKVFGKPTLVSNASRFVGVTVVGNNR